MIKDIFALPVLILILLLDTGAFTKAAHGSPTIALSKNGLYLTKSAPKDLPITEIADFSAGCFWGVEQEFRKLHGVIATAVGFEGGHTQNPSYQDVCNHDTGHAETVRVEFDPKIVSYGRLLEIFWNLHDPTSVNRQGPDVGDQYRSVIFYHSEAQHKEALKSKDEVSLEFSQPIATQITPAKEFYKAEEYHQQYVEKGGKAACHLRRKI